MAGYSYKDKRNFVFTEEGQVRLLRVRDRVVRILKKSGAMTMCGAIRRIGGGSFENFACVDRLVELGELVEVPQD